MTCLECGFTLNHPDLLLHDCENIRELEAVLFLAGCIENGAGLVYDWEEES